MQQAIILENHLLQTLIKGRIHFIESKYCKMAANVSPIKYRIESMQNEDLCGSEQRLSLIH